MHRCRDSAMTMIDLYVPTYNDSLEIVITPISLDRYVASLWWQTAGEEVARIGGDLEVPGVDVGPLVEKIGASNRRGARVRSWHRRGRHGYQHRVRHTSDGVGEERVNGVTRSFVTDERSP